MRGERGTSAGRSEGVVAALLVDPGDGAARGLLGQVRVGDRWERPAEAEARLAADARLVALLAEYDRRRERARDAEGHAKLAHWCERNGLAAEALAHFTVTVRLDPKRASAWNRLGYEPHDGRWMTHQQYLDEQSDRSAQKAADARWSRLLPAWKKDLKDPAARDEAEARLAGVDDPRAVGAVWRTFAPGDADDQARAVQILGQIEAPAATQGLALAALYSPHSGVRRAALETLAGRDPNDAAGLLVGLLGDPGLSAPDPSWFAFRFYVQPVGSDFFGSTGVTRFESRWFDAVATYTVDESQGRFSASWESYGRRVAIQWSQQLQNLGTMIDQLVGEAGRRALADEARSRPVREFNARVIDLLRFVTKKDLGDDVEAWRRWWVEELGYAYQAPRPTYDEPIEPKPTYFLANVHYSCFAAGTNVRTRRGPRPIEAVRVGDRVLARDAETGVLAYRPVVSVAHNPPAETLRVRTEDGGSVVATGIHRFWKVGEGWVMARDLRSGDRLRAIDGSTRVISAEPEATQAVYNLEVLGGHSFFVGETGLLVHDKSPLGPPSSSPAGFDSARYASAAR